MKKILLKILDEINKETPRLDYIRGLIEASIEEESEQKFGETHKPLFDSNIKLVDNQNVDEEIIPEVAKAGPIGKITTS